MPPEVTVPCSLRKPCLGVLPARTHPREQDEVTVANEAAIKTFFSNEHAADRELPSMIEIAFMIFNRGKDRIQESTISDSS